MIYLYIGQKTVKNIYTYILLKYLDKRVGLGAMIRVYNSQVLFVCNENSVI